ncbi:MAG: hypothetical protein ACWGNV_01200 [Bacteroidales bacterium]
MKKIIFRKFLLLILYTVINIYFMIFNWKVFTLSLNVNLGPGSIQIPPFVILFLLGFIIIGILSWSNYVQNLRKIIYELEHGVELGKIRNKMVSSKLQEQLMDEKNIEVLRKKLGIADLQQQQESLSKMIREIQTGREELQEKSRT